MYIVVEATNLEKSMQFLSLIAHVGFEEKYQQTHAPRMAERIEELKGDMEQFMAGYYDNWTTRVLTDEQYLNIKQQ